MVVIHLLLGNVHLTGPTSGPENISVRPMSSGTSGRQRASLRTHDDRDDDGTTTTTAAAAADNDGGDDDGDDAVRDVGGGVTLMISWNVRCLVSSLFLHTV